MTSIFLERSFDFSEGEVAPDHIEGYPDLREQEIDKFALVGRDTFDGTDYPLAANIDDLTTAGLLAEARRRHLDRTQPNAGRIQDTVSIVQPGEVVAGEVVKLYGL